MGTITDKLNKVIQSKTAIRNAIAAKGGNIDTTTKFSQYAELISLIDTNEPLTLVNLNPEHTCYFSVDTDAVNFTNLSYSFDKTNWAAVGVEPIEVSNQPLYLKADAVSVLDEDVCKFYITNAPNDHFSNQFEVKGWLKALNGFKEATSNSYYSGLFYGCEWLVKADYLNLGDTIVSGLFRYFFKRCTNLVSAPFLKFKNMADECYKGMFADCTNLVFVPEIKAEVMTYQCFNDMFNGCKNLDTIKINVSDWHTTNAENWLANIPMQETISSGNGFIYGIPDQTIEYNRTLFVPDGCNIPSNTVSGVPDGWCIIYK